MNVSLRIIIQAGSVADALSMLAELKENGIDAGAPMVARAASPIVAKGAMGANESALAEFLGISNRRPTISSKCVETFSLTGDRENQCAQFLAMLQSGEAVKTEQGYKLGGGRTGSQTPSSDIADIDPDECV